MASTILLKRSSTPGAIPNVLSVGELALNTYDGKLYAGINNSVPSVIEIGGGGGTADTGPISQKNAYVSTNTTIDTGKNGFSIGPITILSGKTVTVSEGATWVIY